MIAIEVGLVTRKMQAGDDFSHLPSILGPLQLDPAWVWVAEGEGRPVAVLAASSAHGMFVLWRLVAAEDAPKNAVLCVLKHAFQDAREMGLGLFVTMLTGDEQRATKFARILGRKGATPKAATLV